MINKNILRKIAVTWGLVLLFAFGLAACQTTEVGSPPEAIAPPAETNPPATQQSEQPSNSETQSAPTAQTSQPTSSPIDSPPDPAAIEAEWQSSPHADSYILDTQNQNNTCARCHAPINWSPSMDELPESCYACKFELEDPPPLIAESEWTDIPCKVCHKVDKKNKVQPEYAWLEIAPLDEYIEVASPTELCLKCHAPVDIPGHASVVVSGDHPDYECTRCHSAHSTVTSCSAAGCHSDIIESPVPIAGHDADHQAVSCVACHDGSGMEVGPDEETGIWITFVTGSTGDRFPFTSHNVVLEASCDRCHFINNPWGLSDNVAQP